MISDIPIITFECTLLLCSITSDNKTAQEAHRKAFGPVLPIAIVLPDEADRYKLSQVSVPFIKRAAMTDQRIRPLCPT